MSVSSSQILLFDESLHPPALAADAAAGEVPWVLLEKQAYVADRRNHTTAYADTIRGDPIQVTLVLARPPRVSYLCVSCASPDGTEAIRTEPEVLATDGDLLLLRTFINRPDTEVYEIDYYIYRPAGDAGPELTCLKRPPRDPNEVGLLSLPTSRDRSGGFTLRPHRPPEDKLFMVAALCDDETFPLASSQLGLSPPLHWSRSTTNKGGTVGFVDLWRGILVCDVLRVQESPTLRYVPLPPPLRPGGRPEGDPRLSRDIAVVGGRIRYVQQQLHWEYCPAMDDFVADGWMADIWSRIDSNEMNIDSAQLGLLPKQLGDEGQPLPPFKRCSILQPTLSLHEDDPTLCFMVKMNPGDARAWVVSVDMVNKILQGVVEFCAERYVAVGFAYLHSSISRNLEAPVYKGKLEATRIATGWILQEEAAFSPEEGASNPDDSDILAWFSSIPGC
ncbi:hypothetical protein ACP4OV_010969 [Aristida adscensionis]